MKMHGNYVAWNWDDQKKVKKYLYSRCKLNIIENKKKINRNWRVFISGNSIFSSNRFHPSKPKPLCLWMSQGNKRELSQPKLIFNKFRVGLMYFYEYFHRLLKLSETLPDETCSKYPSKENLLIFTNAFYSLKYILPSFHLSQ